VVQGVGHYPGTIKRSLDGEFKWFKVLGTTLGSLNAHLIVSSNGSGCWTLS